VSVGYSDTGRAGYGTTTVQFGRLAGGMSRSSAPRAAEVERLRRDGPTAADLQIVKEADKNDLVQALAQNAYWLNALQSATVWVRTELSLAAPSAPTR
jgi:hypothetical protein